MPSRRTIYLALTSAAALGVAVGLAAAARVWIETPNVAPVAALALFAGFVTRRRWVGVAAAVAAMLLSDTTQGFYDWRLMAVVYAMLAAPALLGPWLRRADGRLGVARTLGASLAGSVAFFLVTNAAVWAVSPWYGPGLTGLGSALAAGVPFFRNTLAGDLAFNAVLFGGYALATSPAVRTALTAPARAASA